MIDVPHPAWLQYIHCHAEDVVSSLLVFHIKAADFLECFVHTYSNPPKSAWLGSKYLTPLKKKKKGILKKSLLEVNSRVAFLPLLFSTAAVGRFCVLDTAGTGFTWGLSTRSCPEKPQMPVGSSALAPERCCGLASDGDVPQPLGWDRVLPPSLGSSAAAGDASDPASPVGSRCPPDAKGAARLPFTVLRGCIFFVVLYSLYFLKSLNYVGK